MNSEAKRKIIKKVIGIGVVGVLTVLVIIGFEMVKNSTNKGLPENFSKVYEKSSQHNKKLVSLIKSVNENINEINNLDLNNKREKSTQLIKETRKKNQKARKEAQKLSVALNKLKNIIKKMPASEQKQVASSALEVEVKLANELKSYTDKIDKFLTTLEKAVAKDSTGDRLSVEKRLSEVNKKKQLINSLNSKFLAKVEQLGSTEDN